MKKCPRCGTQYSDDTLSFCLQDRTPLTFVTEAEIPTVVLSEEQLQAARARRNSSDTAWQNESKRKGNVALAVGLTAIGMLVLFSVIGLFAWAYFKSSNSVPDTVIRTSVVATPTAAVAPKESPTSHSTRPSTSPTSSKTVEVQPPPSSDSDVSPTMESDVVRSLESWSSAAEAQDLPALMEHYAPKVDYYNRLGVSSAFVRDDKMRALSRYPSIKMRMSNIDVTAEPDGTAVVALDKEWNFGNGQSEGKVREVIRLRRLGGDWRIVGERDIKVYYKR